MTREFTMEHKTYPIIVPGIGNLQCTTPSTFKAKVEHKAKPSHSGQGGGRKGKRNFRIHGNEDGRTFTEYAKATKYVRSGGPERHAQRVARSLARQTRLKTNAARRLEQTDRRYDRRILKAAEHFIDALD